jgi:transglutaminase-like putative cysteine protease
LVHVLIATLLSTLIAAGPGKLGRAAPGVPRARATNRPSGADVAMVPTPRLSTPSSDAVWRRSQFLQAELERQPLNGALPQAAVGPLLDSAQAKVPAPHGFARLRFPPKDLSGAAEEVQRARAVVAASLARGQAWFDAMHRRVRGAHKDDISRKIDAQRHALEERAAAFASATEAISDSIAHGRAVRYLAQLVALDPGTRLERLRATVRTWEQQPSILGSELNYVRGDLQVRPPPAGNAIPAYMAADTASAALALEDTSVGREVELSDDVIAKSRALGSVKAARDFVMNEIRLDWYYGCLKGSTETLHSGRGNDADLAALLIALLRAQGTQARFVRGTIVLPVEKLADLMGLLSAGQSGPLSDAIPDKALAGLSSAGVPYEPVQAGGRIAAVRMLHVWVEAYLPYSNYRGVGPGQEGKQWIPIDPAFPGSTKYTAAIPQVDVVAEMGQTAAQLTDAYLAQSSALSPLEFVEGRVQDLLASRFAGTQYAQVVRTVEQHPERAGVLPASLPYEVVSVLDENAFLPDDFHHTLQLTVRDGAGILLSAAVPLHEIAGHRTVLSFKPATAADEELLSEPGGVYRTPAALVQMNPVLRIDGVERGVAIRSVGLGGPAKWSLELRMPGGAKRSIENDLVVGNLVAIGVGTPGIGFVEPAQTASTDLDGDAAKFLYGRAAAYENAWTESEEELGRLLGVVTLHPTAGIVLVENQLQVSRVLGIPQLVEWKGVEVDADLRSTVPLELSPGRGQVLLRLSGYEGSFQEAKVLADGTGVAAVSAATVLQSAAAAGIPVLRLGPSDRAALAELQASPAVQADVLDQLARGREIIIPENPVMVQDWTGTGYVVRDPATDEGGYVLSGQISGGQTVVTPANWPPGVVSALSNGDAPPAETDVTKATAIVKVAGDLQGAAFSQALTVGTVATERLAVKVMTSDGRPVKGATVFFSRPSFAGVPAQGGALSTAQCGLAVNSAILTRALQGDAKTVIAAVHALPGQVSAVTDAWGMASVAATPDPVIGTNGTRANDPSGTLSELMQVVVYAVVGAGTPQEKQLFPQQPFLLVARADAVAKVNQNGTGPGPVVGGVEMRSILSVIVSDRFGNRLAGQRVHWTSDHADARFVDPALPPVPGRADLHPRLLDPSDASQLAAVDVVTPQNGQVNVSHIPPFSIVNDAELITAAAGGISTSFAIPLVAAPTYTWALAAGRNKVFDGVTGQPYPDIFIASLYENVANTWQPIRGDELRFASATVTMSVTDSATGARLQGDVTWAPFERDPQLPDDDDTHVVFRPPYLIDGGTQRLTFSARIRTASGSVECCDDTSVLDASASSVHLSLARVTQDLRTIAIGGEPALSTDRSLQLHVDHMSSAPLYLRIVDPAGALVIPGAEGLPRAAFAPDLVIVPAGSAVQAGARLRPVGPAFEFPVSGAAGDVSFEVYSPFFAEAGVTPTSLNLVASGKVSFVADPCEPLVTVSTIDKDDSENTSFAPVVDRIVYAGTGARTTDIVKLNAAVVPGSTLTNVTWSVAGPGAFAYTPPGSPSNEWVLGPIQDNPGRLTFLVTGTCGGRSVQATSDVEVGRRTDAVLAVGFIDPERVPVDDVQDVQLHDDVLQFFPRPPNEFSSTGQKLLTAAYVGGLAFGAATRPLGGGLTLNDRDAKYILYWLFSRAGNHPPKQPPASFTTESSLRDFRDNQTTSFKLFNQFQIKFTGDASGYTRVPAVVRHDARIGVTNDPIFGIEDPGRPGATGANDRVLLDFQKASLINDGTPSATGVSAFNVLTSVIAGTYPDVVHSPLKWSDIGSRIEFSASRGFPYNLYTQVYPTYVVYRNRVPFPDETVFQNPTPLGNFNANPYPPGPAPFIP